MDPTKDARTPRPLKRLALATGAGLLIVIAALAAIIVPDQVRQALEPVGTVDALVERLKLPPTRSPKTDRRVRSAKICEEVWSHQRVQALDRGQGHE
ncbi:MAG TPA: hypothetical protein VM492_11220 [Sumerlaeia bacterium]|nr:hypothetical protein [Sumerlaeia bacterium]